MLNASSGQAELIFLEIDLRRLPSIILRTMKRSFLLLSALLFSGLTLHAEDHKLTGENTTIKFVGTKKDGKHEGSFKKVEGTLSVDAADVSKSKLTVTIDIDSMTTDADKLTAHLKSPDFFDAKANPTAKFVSTAVNAGKEKDTYSITGDLTLLGKTNKVTFDAKAVTADGTKTVSGQTTIKRSQWGMTYGPDKVNDEVQLTLEVKLKSK